MVRRWSGSWSKDTWGASGDGDAGGVSIGGIGTIVEGHEDTGTGGVEGVCLVCRKAASKTRQERRKKTATPDAGQKYGDSGGGGVAAVRQETTTLSVRGSSSHTYVNVLVWANAQILRNAKLKNNYLCHIRLFCFKQCHPVSCYDHQYCTWQLWTVWPLFVGASIAKTFSLPKRSRVYILINKT